MIVWCAKAADSVSCLRTVHCVGLREGQFGWPKSGLDGWRERIFPGGFEPMKGACRSSVSQCVVEHEDDADRLAPREDCVNRQMKNIFTGSIATRESDLEQRYCDDSPATG